MIGCHCAVCSSNDVRDKRTRPSVVISYSDTRVLVDTTPELRLQCVANGVDQVDAIVFTHAHADHIMGLDDVRPINLKQKGHIPIYGSPETLATVHRTFSYVFESLNPESTLPKLTEHPIENGEAVDLFGVPFRSLLLHHGRGRVYGYRFGNAAYLTDHSEIPETSMARLQGLDVLFLDALRHKPHPTHTTNRPDPPQI
jgi:phosphoribosyl 1,2-cyclic phosphate phosphodiesterase